MVAEKRKPALMDSFFQSLVLAPLFVWFELLFLLGYRRGLYKDVQVGGAACLPSLWRHLYASWANWAAEDGPGHVEAVVVSEGWCLSVPALHAAAVAQARVQANILAWKQQGAKGGTKANGHQD